MKRGASTGRTSASTKVDFHVLKNLSVADTFKGKSKPTLAGALIFSKYPPQQAAPFSRYIIRCVRYKGASVSTPIIDKADIYGTLDKQIDETQKFILKNIRLSATIQGTQRVERYEYPLPAIREIVANAVIH